MTENESDKQSDTAQQSRGWNKTTEFGEPLWLDVLKSVGSGLLMLLIFLCCRCLRPALMTMRLLGTLGRRQ